MLSLTVYRLQIRSLLRSRLVFSNALLIQDLKCPIYKLHLNKKTPVNLIKIK